MPLVPVAGELFDGLPETEIVNPGYGIYVYYIHGGTTLATNGDGKPLIARNGTVFYNGFLSDTFDVTSIGVQYILRELGIIPLTETTETTAAKPCSTLILERNSPSLIIYEGDCVTFANDGLESVKVTWKEQHKAISTGTIPGGEASTGHIFEVAGVYEYTVQLVDGAPVAARKKGAKKSTKKGKKSKKGKSKSNSEAEYSGIIIVLSLSTDNPSATSEAIPEGKSGKFKPGHREQKDDTTTKHSSSFNPVSLSVAALGAFIALVFAAIWRYSRHANPEAQPLLA